MKEELRKNTCQVGGAVLFFEFIIQIGIMIRINLRCTFRHSRGRYNAAVVKKK